ncbi:MAG: hypothetical protein M1831_003042 [Alyxoria varia]|nr:MAG: hypothetical protein M1831_003042 [Alyxoria varia]
MHMLTRPVAPIATSSPSSKALQNLGVGRLRPQNPISPGTIPACAFSLVPVAAGSQRPEPPNAARTKTYQIRDNVKDWIESLADMLRDVPLRQDVSSIYLPAEYPELFTLPMVTDPDEA